MDLSRDCLESELVNAMGKGPSHCDSEPVTLTTGADAVTCSNDDDLAN